MINPFDFVDMSSIEMVAIFDKATGQNVRVGTTGLEALMTEEEDFIVLPPGTEYRGKVVDPKTRTLVDPPQAVLDIVAERKLAEQWALIRKMRDGMIASTDYLVTPDYPLTAEQLAAVKSYRQALRDVTKQPDPYTVVWPDDWKDASAN